PDARSAIRADDAFQYQAGEVGLQADRVEPRRLEPAKAGVGARRVAVQRGDHSAIDGPAALAVQRRADGGHHREGPDRAVDDLPGVARWPARAARVTRPRAVAQVVDLREVVVGGQEDHVVDAALVDELQQPVALVAIPAGPGLRQVQVQPHLAGVAELLDRRRD